MREVEFATFFLEVLSGPDADQVLSMGQGPVRIGTAPDNDLVLTDPTVSRYHAELRLEDGEMILKDLGSTNGSFVDELKVREAAVEPGQSCRFGSTRVAVGTRLQTRRGLVGTQDRLGDLRGASPAMRELYALLEAVAPTDVTLLVTGETGTGKELVARTVHQLSGRQGPLVVLDAATTDPAMIRSDLFGHVRGAFTGAERDREGAFRSAHRGTLMIDEIGELPLDVQPMLLRALESRQVTPVGSDASTNVDVRVVAATHRDLPAMVAAGRFREDLLHRLSVVPVEVPPLRDRLGDVELLVEHFLALRGLPLELSPEAREALRGHPWPGNVRALRNEVDRLLALRLGREDPVRVEDLRLPAAPSAGAATGPAAPAMPPEAAAGSLDSSQVRWSPAYERRLIEEALVRNRGNKAATARELGLSLSTLKRRLQSYEP